MFDYRGILKQYWGYDAFRGIQENIIHSIGEGKDTLGLMPTGGGKSITFQVPALAKPGLCLVITPLVALMKDQVRNLKRKGIKAIAVYSGMTREQIQIAYDNCMYGDYKFLYISPERIATDLFRNKVRFMHVSMITVDESHCISQWGYDFRPSYLKIAEIRELLPDVPVLALTATATPEVIKDIQVRLAFRQENVFRMSFERQNIAYVVRETDDKMGELLHILTRMSGSCIVYTRSREKTQEIARLLVDNGLTATFFHAGLNSHVKDERQVEWSENRCRVMVATNAFGMGIDKPDVRLVVHIDFPDSPEAYFQEAGRAGRDGQKAFAVLLHAKSDKNTLLKRLEDTFPPKEYVRKVYEDLQYYFQMAMGDGMGTIHAFDLAKFCINFKHFPVRAENALRILTRAGYLEYTEEQDNPSRVKFVLKKEDLYHIRQYNRQMEQLIEGLLRFYTGIFTDYAYIDEHRLEKFTGLSRDEIYENLLFLSRSGVISYIPGTRCAFIFYTCNRREAEHIYLSKEVYEERKEAFAKRLEAMMRYAETTDVCRSRLLLDYFGETNRHNCGMCDVCLSNHSSGLKWGRFSQIAEEIIALLKATPQSVTDVQQQVDADSEEVQQVLSYLIAEEKIEQRHGLLYVINDVVE